MGMYNLKLLKLRSPIAEVARELGFEVNGMAMRCLHPTNHKHLDANPSLTFDSESNSFRCWVCPGVRGDVIEFVKLAKNVTFFEAVTYLAKRAGLHPITNLSSPAQQPGASRQIKPSSANDEFVDVYEFFLELCSELPNRAVKWLENRGVSLETAQKQQVAYVKNLPEVYDALMSRFPVEQLRQSGLFNTNDKLMFSIHRLIWPYFRNGRLVYLQGRTLDANRTPKELCLARPVPCPYNVDILASKPETVFVCEGCLDTLTLLEQGLSAVGIPGACNFKEDWFDLFKGVHVKVALDADIPGKTRSAELVQTLRGRDITATKIYLPDNYDVNQLFQAVKQLTG